MRQKKATSWFLVKATALVSESVWLFKTLEIHCKLKSISINIYVTNFGYSIRIWNKSTSIQRKKKDICISNEGIGLREHPTICTDL